MYNEGEAFNNTQSLRIEVEDSGPGITLDAQESLFDEFTQADHRTTRKFGGTGLGLAICKKLTELMGGEIGIDSVPGKGSTFWLTLQLPLSSPLNPTPLSSLDNVPILDEYVTPTIESKTFSTKASILVVEDLEPNQIIARTFLERMGASVDIAENGEEAIERYKKHHYDLIFMDYRMPVMNGYDATIAIRQLQAQQPDITSIPIIGLTANASNADMEKCKKAGMDDVITKPFKRTDISDCLEKWLST